MTIMDNDLFPRGGKVQTHKKEGAPKKRKNESLFKVLSFLSFDLFLPVQKEK